MKEIMSGIRRYVGYARGRSSAGSGGNAVGVDLYRETEGSCGTVSAVTTNILGVCIGEGLRERWTQKGGLVAPRGNRETTLGHLGRSLTGS